MSDNPLTLADIQRQLDRLEKKIDRLSEFAKSNKPIRKKDWYRPSEVCELLGISRSKFETLKRTGIIPIQKLQGAVYVSASFLESIIKDGKSYEPS